MIQMISASNKACEICGTTSPEAYYSFIGEAAYIIILNSPHVQNHNPATRVVTFTDGQSAEYNVCIGDIGVKLKPVVIPHIFCSEACERELAHNHPMWSPEFPQKTAIFSCASSDMPISWPIVMDADILKLEICQCAQCSHDFPNTHKKFTVEEIQDTTVIEGIQGKIGIPPGFTGGQSDTKKDGERGNFYFYKFFDIPHESKPRIQLCSDECAYDYAKSNNCALFYPNNVVKGFITMIFPFTVEINQALGNAYKYRPHKICPL